MTTTPGTRPDPALSTSRTAARQSQQRLLSGLVAIALVTAILSMIFQRWAPQIADLIGRYGAAFVGGGLFMLLAFVWAGYHQPWDRWTGFRVAESANDQGRDGQATRTLWDWMQLLIAPAVLAVAGLWFSQWFSQQQQIQADKTNLDQGRETLLNTYLSAMSDLLLNKDYALLQSTPGPGAPNWAVARARTLEALRRLDGFRKGQVVRFLIDASVLKELQLQQADLGGADLSYVNESSVQFHEANLMGADLMRAELRKADLSFAYLQQADLRRAILPSAHLHRATLSGANLQGADLSGADFSGAQLDCDQQGHCTNLADANLQGANLQGANLRGALHARTATVSGVTWSGTRCPDGTNSDKDGRTCVGHGF
jgi:uncharacterized protein YjbI with pentapeptide repeats